MMKLGTGSLISETGCSFYLCHGPPVVHIMFLFYIEAN